MACLPRNSNCSVISIRLSTQPDFGPDLRKRWSIAATEELAAMAPGRIRLSVAEARDLAEGALRGVGYRDDEARIIADHVIDAALCGYEYSGLAKILNIPASEHFKLPRRPMRAMRETDVSLASMGATMSGCWRCFTPRRRRSKRPRRTGLRWFR
jgi:hypothetical protein